MGTDVPSLDAPMIRTMVLETSIGWASMLRIALLVTATIGVVALRPGKNVRWCAISALYGLAVATLPWEGHAAASEGADGLFHRSNDAVHLLVGGLWIGAIGWFLALTIKAHRHSDQDDAMPLIDALHSFRPLGIALVAIVAVTGAINAQLIFGIDSVPSVMATSYGQLLAAKLALVALMLLCAARHAAISKFEANSGQTRDRKRALAVLRRSLAIEAGLALAILSLVAVIGMISPMG